MLVLLQDQKSVPRKILLARSHVVSFTFQESISKSNKYIMNIKYFLQNIKAFLGNVMSQAPR